MSVNPVVVTKLIKASKQELFEAFTNPQIMSKWFYPDEDMSVEVSNTFHVGGGYVLKMHNKNGEVYTHIGEYMEISPPDKLVFSWNSDFVENTVVSVTFSEKDGATEVKVSHDLLPNDEMRENHQGGWNGCLDRLKSTMSA